MEFVAIFLLFVAIAVVVRLTAGSLDGPRIDAYIRKRGGRVISKRWTPFGRGWFGERSDRIYEVVYEGRDGERRRATVKTSMWTGVYLTDDAPLRRGAAEPRQADKATELERLRAENARLKAELTKRD